MLHCCSGSLSGTALSGYKSPLQFTYRHAEEYMSSQAWGGGFRGSQNHINHTYATQFTNQQRQKWLVLFPADAGAAKPLKLACPSMLGSFTRWRMYNKMGSHCFTSIKELFQFSIFKNVFKFRFIWNHRLQAVL